MMEAMEHDFEAYLNQLNADSNFPYSVETGESSAVPIDYSGSLIGLTGKTLDDMFEIYKKHATLLGFSVRRGKQRNTVKNVISGKYFVCSCEGFRADKSSSSSRGDGDYGDEIDSKRKRLVPLTRTGCNASMKVRLNKASGLYEVVGHSLEHNHPMTRPQWQHHHRQERVMSKEKGEYIAHLRAVGLTATESFDLVCEEAGDRSAVGHLYKDHINFCYKLKMLEIEGGDAQNVIDMLGERGLKEKDFFFRVRVDEDGRLCSLFWRDSMMLEDFNIYGDITVFDTTYRTNKYNLICAPFVGVNNHWKNVFFGCAFLSNEKVESFEWLFETFKKSMLGKCPTTVFTDQDFAINAALAKVFPDSRHRLCLWHLQQNAVTHFGYLKQNEDFKDDFKKVLMGCDTPEEFESHWADLLSNYGLEGEPYFKRLYDLRLKWCPALSKDFFSAGILSSQRSESTNNAIGFNASKTTTLTDFFKIFESTVKRWRGIEEDDEFKCSNTIPTASIPMNGLLKSASKVYTLTLFKFFSDEYYASLSTHSKIVCMNGNEVVYEASIDGEASNMHRVVFDPIELKICCTCKLFEECGWLCFHCLRILNINSIFDIPERYIVKRWTKYAKTEIWDRMEKEGTHLKKKEYFPWRQSMARRCYNLLLKSSDSLEARQIVEQGIEKLFESVRHLGLHKVGENQGQTTCNSVTSSNVLDPSFVKTKGRSQRIKNHFQKRNPSKTSAKATGSTADSPQVAARKEFGTRTPIPRLF